MEESVRNAYIKFLSNEDSVLGFYELVTHSQVTRLSNDIYCVPWSSLAILDSRQVEYSFATEEDLTNAHPIWGFAAAKTR
ncbi:MAG: hypothetical protein ABIY70_23575 [Capsulimonas sp.]|jgi:hypothetical protein|uniref:hypothetical protein n=1 Tax=Capsulimonas sp. TaxID=2494211 RepID=UPI003262E54F